MVNCTQPVLRVKTRLQRLPPVCGPARNAEHISQVFRHSELFIEVARILRHVRGSLIGCSLSSKTIALLCRAAMYPWYLPFFSRSPAIFSLVLFGRQPRSTDCEAMAPAPRTPPLELAQRVILSRIGFVRSKAGFRFVLPRNL